MGHQICNIVSMVSFNPWFKSRPKRILMELMLFIFWPILWLLFTSMIATAVFLYALYDLTVYIRKPVSKLNNFCKKFWAIIGLIFVYVIGIPVWFVMVLSLWALFYTCSVLYCWVWLVVVFVRKEKTWN